MLVPLSLKVLFYLLVFSTSVFILFAAKKVLLETAPSIVAQKYFQRVGMVLLTWLMITAIGGASGFFSNFDAFPPRPMFFLVSMVGFLIYLLTNKVFMGYATNVPAHWIVGYQFFRLPVEIFLYELFTHELGSKAMTFEGYNYEIIIALLAPILAYGGLVKNWIPLRWIIIWNYLGILTLITIATIGVLSLPLPFRQFMDEPGSRFVAHYPFVWLPAFLVPFAFLSHVISVKQILQKGKKA